MRNRKKAHHYGLWAEKACIFILRLKGYSILASRIRTHAGEIDIVAKRGGLLAFIEVKARREANAAIESVTSFKQQRLVAAAQSYLASSSKFAGLDMRFDLMVVVPWRLPNHIMDAWRT